MDEIKRIIDICIARTKENQRLLMSGEVYIDKDKLYWFTGVALAFLKVLLRESLNLEQHQRIDTGTARQMPEYELRHRIYILNLPLFCELTVSSDLKV